MQKNIKNEFGFGLVELLLVVLVLSVIGFGGYYVYHTQSSTPAKTTAVVAVKTNTPAPAKAEDPYANWKTYTDTAGHFSLKYPATWVTADHPELCSPGILLIAPTKGSVGKCASEGFGQVAISSYSQTNTSCPDNFTSTDYTNIKKETVTVSGVSGTKQSGVTKSSNSVGMGGVEAGVVMVNYCFTTAGKHYVASYGQAASDTDVLETFNAIVTKTLSFN